MGRRWLDLTKGVIGHGFQEHPRLLINMKRVVGNNNLWGQILYRRPENRRQCKIFFLELPSFLNTPFFRKNFCTKFDPLNDFFKPRVHIILKRRNLETGKHTSFF